MKTPTILSATQPQCPVFNCLGSFNLLFLLFSKKPLHTGKPSAEDQCVCYAGQTFHVPHRDHLHIGTVGFPSGMISWEAVREVQLDISIRPIRVLTPATWARLFYSRRSWIKARGGQRFICQSAFIWIPEHTCKALVSLVNYFSMCKKKRKCLMPQPRLRAVPAPPHPCVRFQLNKSLDFLSMSLEKSHAGSLKEEITIGESIQNTLRADWNAIFSSDGAPSQSMTTRNNHSVTVSLPALPRLQSQWGSSGIWTHLDPELER